MRCGSGVVVCLRVPWVAGALRWTCASEVSPLVAGLWRLQAPQETEDIVCRAPHVCWPGANFGMEARAGVRAQGDLCG